MFRGYVGGTFLVLFSVVFGSGCQTIDSVEREAVWPPECDDLLEFPSGLSVAEDHDEGDDQAGLVVGVQCDDEGPGCHIHRLSVQGVG